MKSASYFHKTSGVTEIQSSQFNLDPGGNIQHSATLNTGGVGLFGGGVTAATITTAGTPDIPGTPGTPDTPGTPGNSLDALASNYDDLVSTFNDHVHISASPGSNNAPTTTKGTISHNGSPVQPSLTTVDTDVPNPAEPGDPTPPELAFWTNIIPQHEPWARTFIKDYEQNVDHTPEFDYTSSSVNKDMKKVKDTDRKRGKLWHR
jgi:hypothetical protein